MPHCRRRLPLELECEIFKCLKLPIQRRFICGLGRGIYCMFGQKLLTKSTRLRNPIGNRWNCNCTSNTTATISPNGLSISHGTMETPIVFAEQGFPISKQYSRKDHFPGTILYYFEVTDTNTLNNIMFFLRIGLSVIPSLKFFGCNGRLSPLYCYLAKKRHRFERPNGIQPKWDGNANISGCGLLVSATDQVSIFFTGNGVLLGKQIPITSSVDFLYPTVHIYGRMRTHLEANFGDDLAKPFKYDIGKCPGMDIIPIQQD